jgi:hypothetical protein
LTALDQSQIEDYINGPLYSKPDARTDDIPEPPARPMVKAGDLWQLGKHKLLCGSSLDFDFVSKVTRSKPILLAITDPPFDLDSHKQAQALRLAGVKTAIVFGGGKEVFRLANLEDYKLRFDFVILYDRPVSLTGNKSLIYRHNRALLLDEDDVGFSSGLVLGKEINFDRQKWQSVTGTKCSVLEAPVQKDLYRYGKCCDVFRAFVRAMESDVVYDPFAGSGTGMIACQIENKTWVGMEIEAAVCDIAVLRWQNFTGQKAKLA